MRQDITIFQPQCMIDDATLKTLAYFGRTVYRKINNYFLITNLTKDTLKLPFFFTSSGLLEGLFFEVDVM